MRTQEEIRAESDRLFALWASDRPTVTRREAELQRAYLWSAIGMLRRVIDEGSDDDKIRRSWSAINWQTPDVEDRETTLGFAAALNWLIGGHAVDQRSTVAA